MLRNCDTDRIEYGGGPSHCLPYEVADARLEIIDPMTVRFRAVFNGPPDTEVIGRAWISDAEGTMIEGKTNSIPAGSREELILTIPAMKIQNGDLIACMRVEWPLYETKHVMRWTLLKGEIVHPPKSKPC